VTPEPYEIVLTPPARRALTYRLPEPVSAAAIDFTTSALIENPHRVGQQLRFELSGVWSARRGTYRILYRINEARREVIVVRIEHRRDAYRSGR
jgi:mRNA interferase RelE/StbE